MQPQELGNNNGAHVLNVVLFSEHEQGPKFPGLLCMSFKKNGAQDGLATLQRERERQHTSLSSAVGHTLWSVPGNLGPANPPPLEKLQRVGILHHRHIFQEILN